MLVENPSPRIPLEDVLFIVRPRRKPLEPFLSNVDLALSGASVDLLQPVGSRVDQAVVGQGFEEGVTGKADDFPLLAVEIDCEKLDDAVRDFLGGRRWRWGWGWG